MRKGELFLPNQFTQEISCLWYIGLDSFSHSRLLLELQIWIFNSLWDVSIDMSCIYLKVNLFLPDLPFPMDFQLSFFCYNQPQISKLKQLGIYLWILFLSPLISNRLSNSSNFTLEIHLASYPLLSILIISERIQCLFMCHRWRNRLRGEVIYKWAVEESEF